MSIADDVLQMVAAILAQPGATAPERLADALRLLAKFRSEILAHVALSEGNTRVRSGPFEGMELAGQVAEGSTLPKLLGTYESELHEVIRSWTSRGYDLFIDIGCAEGYYAVGLPRLLPGLEVRAYDTDPAARSLCRGLAEKNGVSDRVTVGTEFRAEKHAPPPGRRTLVLCDVEGDETSLLDSSEPWTAADLLVEVHDVFTPGSGTLLAERFGATHEIRRISSGARTIPPIPELYDKDHLDQLLSIWEWRLRDNYWLWMESRGGG